MDEGKYQPVMTHTRSPTNLPTRIGNPISFYAVALKSSKVTGVTFKFGIATSSIDIPDLTEAKKETIAANKGG